MKNTFAFIILIMVMIACQDQEAVFSDNTYKAVYFPVQLPLRTLSLGEDRIDNSLDREFKFDIGLSIGGMYNNEKNWTVDYVVDNTLTDSVYTNTTPSYKIKPLPTSYYTLDPLNTAVIPKGSFNGLIRVQLNDQFFNDTLATLGRYVIPLTITGSSADSILKGKALTTIPVPDRRNKSHYEASMSPKDWVMFGIKYYNAYHGNYLHRGRDIRVVTATGVPFDTVKFRNKYIERDALIKLTTIGRKKVMTNGVGNKLGTNYSMELNFADDKGSSGAITINPRPGLAFAVSGTGQYFDKAASVETWSLLKWQSMYLSYSYIEGIYTHQITDTLVFRDRDIKYEELSIKIVTP